MVMMKKVSRNLKKSKPGRRSAQRPLTIMTRSMTRGLSTVSRVTPGGFFQTLPSELFDMILDKMLVREISVLSLVSREMSRYVLDYISTQAWKNKMIVLSFHYSTSHEHRSTVAHYRDMGLLFKRCTLLLPTKERLKFICSRLSLIPCFMLEQCIVPNCFGFSCYGVFLQTLIAGWDQVECYRVFSFLCETTNLLQKINTVITANPGVKWYQELQLRLFCRQVLLDPWLNQPHCQFWLMQLLNPWPIVSQAHLLLILYGPLLPDGTLSWQDLVERGLPRSALWDLAKAIILVNCKPEETGWTSDSILAILQELTVIPQPWHVQNVACLLVLCGSRLCHAVLASKALNGRLPEISRLIVHMILVCEKEGYHMSWVLKLVQQICKVFSTDREKFCFIQQVENMFSEIIREFLEFSVGNPEDREAFQNLFILLESSAHFHTEVLHMFLKQ